MPNRSIAESVMDNRTIEDMTQSNVLGAIGTVPMAPTAIPNSQMVR